ncbi:MAG: hypothetical protein GY679_03290 [Mycoplasma sp.]|nr:hypothetical protein [Mycoplasma sp.]
MKTKIWQYIKFFIITLFILLSIIGYSIRSNELSLYITIIQIIILFAYLITRKTRFTDILLNIGLLFLAIFCIFMMNRTLMDQSSIKATFDSVKWMLIFFGVFFWLSIIFIVFQILFKERITREFWSFQRIDFKLFIYSFFYYFIVTIIVMVEYSMTIVTHWNPYWIIGLFSLTIIASSTLFWGTSKFLGWA